MMSFLLRLGLFGIQREKKLLCREYGVVTILIPSRSVTPSRYMLRIEDEE